MLAWWRKRWVKRTLLSAGTAAGLVALLAGAAAVTLLGEDSGTVSAGARSTNDDGLWLGHAWVDGRKGPGDVASLAARLRATGIRDLLVHTGPLGDDGTLNPALSPRARWLIGTLHRALPGVRVQAGSATSSARAISTWLAPSPGITSQRARGRCSAKALTACTWTWSRSARATRDISRCCGRCTRRPSSRAGCCR